VRILFDIVHPAHVHFFKHVIRTLEARGHSTHIVARQKDVTTLLLDHLGLRYDVTGRSGRKGRLGQAAELVHRDWDLARVARRFKADMILTRNPAGAQVGRLLGIRSVFDTDDGRAAGVHFWSAAPFAHVITTPDCIGEDYGRRHIQYPGYKQTAYLHPNHFTPDPRVLDELGVAPGQRLFLVRFVEMVASHDLSEGGLPADAKRGIIARLQRAGRVFVTHEGKLPAELEPLRFPLPPDRLHDALAAASLLVGDSQTMAAEAAVLGTPNLRVSSWAGRLTVLGEMQERYGLTYAYRPTQVREALAHLDRWLEEPSLRDQFADKRRRMLEEKVDVAQWFVDLVEAGAPLPREGARAVRRAGPVPSATR
jgi:predicted glycosyltransferase